MFIRYCMEEWPWPNLQLHFGGARFPCYPELPSGILLVLELVVKKFLDAILRSGDCYFEFHIS